MKIAICMPSRDMVHAAFAFDLVNMVGHWTAKHAGSGHSVQILNSTGTLIADQRVNLAKSAVKQGADWTLWLDTDMRFPVDTLDRLVSHNRPIVGCNYSMRTFPPEPTASNFHEDSWVKVYTKPESTGLEQVDLIGFGVALVKTEVFQKLEDPWFHLGYSSLNQRFIGEDVYFCIKAAGEKVPVFIDHDLSKEIRHIGSFEFRNDHIELP